MRNNLVHHIRLVDANVRRNEYMTTGMATFHNLSHLYHLNHYKINAIRCTLVATSRGGTAEASVLGT
jgi:hypothetical protein